MLLSRNTCINDACEDLSGFVTRRNTSTRSAAPGDEKVHIALSILIQIMP